MDFCLSIGIDKYIHLLNTPFAENDALEFYLVMKNGLGTQQSTYLLGSQATRTNIENIFDNIIGKLDEEDRFFLFFAGHGCNFDDSPYICAYDSYNKGTEHTIKSSMISIVNLLEKVNSTGCKRSVFFIDACKSTLRLGSRMVSNNEFSLDEVEEMIRTNTYSCVYSSSSHKGIADIMPEKEHGIWSYFLLQALSGQATQAFLEKTTKLTGNSLATYLNLSVRNYCKSNSECDIQQTFKWGKEEGDFLIHEFPKLIKSEYNVIPQKSLRCVEFVTITISGVKQLSGFKKGVHSIPKFYSSAVDKFINDISHEEIETHITDVSNSLRKLLNLKRRDFEIDIGEGCGSFSCAYFTYSYCVEIDRNDFSSVEFRASLIPRDVNKLKEVSDSLDKCFPIWFDYLIFTLEKSIDIATLIDKIEELDEDEIKNYNYDYDSLNTYIELESIELKRTIIIKPNEIQIKFKAKEEIINMLDSLRDVANQLRIISPNYKLLG